MNFKENPHSFGRSTQFRNRPPRDQSARRPRAEEVSVAMSDSETTPQVAVGGMKEVEELITKEPYKVHRVLFLHQSKNPHLYTLQKIARKNHIHVQQVEARILDSYARPNEGIVALCNEKTLLAWQDIAEEFLEAKEKDIQKIIAVGTNIEDPRNLGACIRSSLALDVDLLLIPAKGMCGITPTVARTSAGALEKLRICRPNNLEAVIAELKNVGYQIVGLDAATDINLAGFPFEKQIVLAVGGEDQGLPAFIQKQCDAIVRIPMKQDAHSYNASVALSLGLYEISRTRI